MSMMNRVCLILCALLLLSSCALAAPTQNLMDFLDGEGIDTSDAAAFAHVLAVGETREALGVALTLEGLYYDGGTLLIGWRTQNLQDDTPALVLYTEVTINGVPVRADADHPVSCWWPSMFGLFVAGDPINNLVDRFIVEDVDGRFTGEAEITAHFTVKRPTKSIAVVDPDIHTPYDDRDTEADRQAMLAAMAAHGVTVAGPQDDPDPAAWAEQGYLVLNRYGEHYLADESAGRAALTGADLPDAQTQDVAITFRVDLGALAAP